MTDPAPEQQEGIDAPINVDISVVLEKMAQKVARLEVDNTVLQCTIDELKKQRAGLLAQIVRDNDEAGEKSPGDDNP